MSQFPPHRTKWERRKVDYANKIYFDRARRLLEVVKQERSQRPDRVKIVCISDTPDHQIPDVPEGDILIHAGDLTTRGTFERLQKQLEWLKSLPHPHKVIIAGNRDKCLDETFMRENAGKAQFESAASTAVDWSGLNYLEDTSVDIKTPNGRVIRVWGSPYTPKFGNFAFQYPRQMTFWEDKIPKEVDIVATHGPPACHLDINPNGAHVGCQHLLQVLSRSKPQLVVFGHIHEAHGEEVLAWDGLQSNWERTTLQKSDVPGFLTYCKHRILSLRWRADPKAQTTHLVNAAIFGPKKVQYQQPVVVFI